MSGSNALVIARGADIGRLRLAPRADHVICADGGLDAALAAGLGVDLAVGDFDSATSAALDRAMAAGTVITRHPADKNETDLELALQAAVERGATSLRVHLSGGGRLDHQLANLLVLASPRWSAAEVDAVVGVDQVWVVRRHRVLPLEPGDPVALHAIGGDARGVRTRGLRFELDDEPLEAMVGRGIANVVQSAQPEVWTAAGVLLAISSPTR